MVIGDQEHLTWTVILAMGAQHRRLDISGEEQYAGRRLSYCAIWNAAFFRNVPTLIVDSGDSAMEVKGISEIDNGTRSTDEILWFPKDSPERGILWILSTGTRTTSIVEQLQQDRRLVTR